MLKSKTAKSHWGDGTGKTGVTVLQFGDWWPVHGFGVRTWAGLKIWILNEPIPRDANSVLEIIVWLYCR